MKIVEVTWEDASFEDMTHRTQRTVEEDTFVVLRSVGYLISRNKRAIRLAMEWRPDSDRVRDILLIPTSLVKKVRVLR